MTSVPPRPDWIEIPDPDDPMGPPAYGGPVRDAGAILMPGTYTGHGETTPATLTGPARLTIDGTGLARAEWTRR